MNFKEINAKELTILGTRHQYQKFPEVVKILSSRSVTDSQQNCGLPLMTRLTQQESRIQKFIYNTLSFFVLKKS